MKVWGSPALRIGRRLQLTEFRLSTQGNRLRTDGGLVPGCMRPGGSGRLACSPRAVTPEEEEGAVDSDGDRRRHSVLSSQA